MPTSRRSFLKQGTLVALAAGVPFGLASDVSAGTIFGESVAPPAAGLGLTKAAFESQLNTQFLINESNQKVALKLVEVAELRSKKSARDGKEGFSLLFRGSHSTPLRQHTYLIEHARLGMFSFLIVPVMSRDKPAPYYEAVINRLHP
jgi:hypothetical protein